MVCPSLRLQGYATLAFPPDGRAKAQAGQTTVLWLGGSLTVKPSCSSKWLPSNCCFLRAPVALSGAATLQGRQEGLRGPCATDSTPASHLHEDRSPTQRSHSLDLHPPGLGKVSILTVGQSSGVCAWQTLPGCATLGKSPSPLNIWILVGSMLPCLRLMKGPGGKVAVGGF